MDLGDNESKYFPFGEIPPFNSDSLPISITVSGIHRAVLEDNLEAVKRLVDAGDSVNFKEEDYEFTPLHLAVLKNYQRIVDYLLSRHDIDVDARCTVGNTPLRIATCLGMYKSVRKLIEAGADVNLPDNDNFSPLHASVCHADVCHLLIQNGADIDAVDSSGRTPLHRAILSASLEAMYVLLYYNADTNVSDENGMTPFTYAIIYEKNEAQHALLDYVDDFNGGDDMNYGDHFFFSNNEDIEIYLGNVKDKTVFKAVWERLCSYRNREPIDVLRLFHIVDRSFLAVAVQIIIESNNFELVVNSFTKYNDLLSCVIHCINSDLEEEQLVVLTYRLLEYGYRPTMDDIDIIFLKYRDCELKRILLYMDIDYTQSYRFDMNPYLRLIFDLKFDLEVLTDKLNYGECRPSDAELLQLLKHFQDPRLVNAIRVWCSYNRLMCDILNGWSKVPSMVELARNQARKHIRERFKVTNICQFHTIIDYLPLPSSIKSILTYRRKIYMVKR